MIVSQLDGRFLRKSSVLSSIQMEKVIPYLDVVRVLNKAKIRFVLAGAYGLALWRKEARATEDVDVIVAANQVKKATAALLTAFPHLEAKDLPVVVRLYDKETRDDAIDIMKPVQQPYTEWSRHTVEITEGRERFRIPSLEMALVMKFSAMSSVYRADEDKFRDAHDFIKIVKANADLNEETVEQLAARIYPDGGKDISRMIAKIRAGERLEL